MAEGGIEIAEQAQTKDQQRVEKIASENLLPALIGFNEACHRFLAKPGNVPDVIIFPQRDATWMGRLWQWAYPEDKDKVEILPWNRKTTFNSRHFDELRALPMTEFTDKVNGRNKVAFIDVGYRMTIPWFVRELRPGWLETPVDFIPPKEVIALAINVRSPYEDHGTDDKAADRVSNLPGIWRGRDIGTMLDLKSPYHHWVDRLRNTGIADPQPLLGTIEPLMGSLQRPIEGVAASDGHIVRGKPGKETGPGADELNKHVRSFREVLKPAANIFLTAVHQDKEKSDLLRRIRNLSNRDLCAFVVKNIAEADKALRKTDFFPIWQQLEEGQGDAWQEIVEDLSPEERESLYQKSRKWVG